MSLDGTDADTGLDAATVTMSDGTVAVDAMTLLARRGELLAVLGPSGSGKSSILRALAGLEKVTSGRVLIGGLPVSAGDPRDVAMVFQDSHLIPFLDAARNMSFPLDLARMPRAESRRRVDEQARRLDLSKLLRRKPATLSPGESARVGLGRALVRVPKAFLLDEPLAHLDPGDRLRMRQRLREVISETGVTTFFVTHDQSEALSIGDRVAVVDRGRIVQVGTSRELYDAPVNTFVAGFVAPTRIGLLPGQVVVSGGMAGYRLAGRTIPTWTAPPAALAGDPDRRVLVGIRPEDVYEVPQPDHGTVTGVIRTYELAGSHATVSIAVGTDELVARFGGHTRARPGDRVTVGIDASRAHVFDADTGVALAHPSD